MCVTPPRKGGPQGQQQCCPPPYSTWALYRKQGPRPRCSPPPSPPPNPRLPGMENQLLVKVWLPGPRRTWHSGLSDRLYLSLAKAALGPRTVQVSGGGLGPEVGCILSKTCVSYNCRQVQLLSLSPTSHSKVCLPSKSWGSLVPSRLRAQQETRQAGGSGRRAPRPDWGEGEGRAHGFHRGNPSGGGHSQKNFAPPLEVPRRTAKDS